MSDPDTNRGLVISVWATAEAMDQTSDTYRAEASCFETVLSGPAVRNAYVVDVATGVPNGLFSETVNEATARIT